MKTDLSRILAISGQSGLYLYILQARNGAIVEASYKDTKRMLGSEYGMEGKVDNDGNGVMKEWFEQSAAFSAFCVGKTASEVAGLQTQEAGGHLIAVDSALLEAGCSMQITGLMAVVAQAANYAR